MNTRSLYLLVPCDYSKPVKEQVIVSKIKMHIGRGKSLQDAADALERELNSGRTVAEIRALPLQERAAAFPHAIHVVSDTWKSWLDYTSAKHWPIMAEIDAMIE